MASTSHRRCQYQGEGCLNVAHAGHDVCSRCYFDYVKPALQAERLEVKRRKELKRLHLSPENRALISEVDLKEPQMVERPDPLPKPSRAIANAIFDVRLDEMLEGKSPAEQRVTVVDKLVTDTLKDVIPLPIKPLVKSPPKEEPPVQNNTPEEVNASSFTRHVHAGGTGSRLTEAQVKEVIDAYQDGMAVSAICNVCNIATTTLYIILREAGVTLRGRPGSQPSPPPPPPPEEEIFRVPPPPRRRPFITQRPPPPRRSTPVMPQNTPPVSPPAVESAPPDGVVSGLTEWVVAYTVTRTETAIIHAKGFAEAAAAVPAGVDVISVAKKLP